MRAPERWPGPYADPAYRCRCTSASETKVRVRSHKLRVVHDRQLCDGLARPSQAPLADEVGDKHRKDGEGDDDCGRYVDAHGFSCACATAFHASAIALCRSAR